MFADKLCFNSNFLNNLNFKDGFVRFWNPESGKQITSKVIDALIESSNEEEQKV